MKSIVIGGERSVWALACGLSVLIPLLLVSHGCDDDRGVIQPARELDFLIVEAPTLARVGDCVLVHWDYRNPNRLSSQGIRLFTVHPSSPCTFALTNDRRNFTFDFEGPVTVEIFATDTSSRQLSATFDIDMESTTRFIVRDLFRAQSPEVNSLLYPRLPTGKLVSFPWVIGFFDRDRDGLLEDAFALGAENDREFFAHAESDMEEALFDWAIGAQFPFRRDGALTSTRADAVVFAMRLAYGARGVVVFPSGKGRTYFKNRNTPVFPVYATLDLAKINNTQYEVIDIHMGDFRLDENGQPYGFTLSRHKNLGQLGEAGTQGGRGIAIKTRRPDGGSNVGGTTEAGRIGHSLVLADRTPVTSFLDGLSAEVPGVFAEFSSIEWFCPLEADDSGELEELIDLGNYCDQPIQNLCSLQDPDAMLNANVR